MRLAEWYELAIVGAKGHPAATYSTNVSLSTDACEPAPRTLPIGDLYLAAREQAVGAPGIIDAMLEDIRG